MEEKNFKEQIIDCIKEICESGTYNINFDEFSIDITLDATRHNIKGSAIYLTNEWDLTYKTTLTEKNGNFHHSIYSSVNPKYIAAYVVGGYMQSKKNYEEKLLKEQERDLKEQKRENNNKSLLNWLFNR